MNASERDSKQSQNEGSNRKLSLAELEQVGGGRIYDLVYLRPLTQVVRPIVGSSVIAPIGLGASVSPFVKNRGKTIRLSA